MVKKIAIGFAILVLVVLAIAALQPDSFRVQRSIGIKARPEKILPLISDFHNWTSWSPWEKLDPSMKRSFSGAAHGRGAVYAWEGNDQVGAGRMEITELRAPRQVLIKLDFLRPFEGHNQTEFLLEAKGDGTTVTWVMSGPSNLITKLIGLVSSMDSMVGKDFETGLANMKAAAEK